MSGKFVVGYDGSDGARRALDFAIERAAAQGGSIMIAHVLEWSPYSFLTPTELEERHKRRKEELERAETALMKPVVAAVSGKGVEIETAIRYGKIADVLCDITEECGGSQIFVGRDGESSLSARVFGTVASALVQCAPVPCTVVP
ncbi:universal stress protein [Roseovarius faecimaris]|uniref:Universal stress protein n=1 Tax=Roseovarius faecimaris TaxID=2494550 RepID=A0A6I6IMJ2_9RHOB|nr:universal stress protein [Roseovarius faecimaris]QGX97003.1 universal stress protein [Roseovarius faecimaris]